MLIFIIMKEEIPKIKRSFIFSLTASAALLFFLILNIAECQGITPFKAALDSMLREADHGGQKWKTYKDIGLLLHTTAPKEALKYFIIADKYALEASQYHDACFIKSLLANQYALTGDYLTAIDSAKSGLYFAGKVGDVSDKIYAYTQLAKIYYHLGRYNSANAVFKSGISIYPYDKLMDSLKIFLSKGYRLDPIGRDVFLISAIFFSNYSEFLCDYGKIEEAIKMAKRALSLVDDSKQLYGKRCIILMNLAGFEGIRNNYKAALEYIERAKYVMTEESNPEFARLNISEIGMGEAKYYEKLNDFRSARLSLINCGRPSFGTTNDKAVYDLMLADVNVKLGLLPEAGKILKKVKKIENELTNDVCLTLYSSLMKYAKAEGDFVSALDYYDKIEDYHDSLSLNGNIDKIANTLLLLQYNVKNTTAEIKMKKELKATAANYYHHLMINFAILLLISCMVICSIFYFQKQRDKKSHAQFAEINEKYDHIQMKLKEAELFRAEVLEIFNDGINKKVGKINYSFKYLKNNFKYMKSEETYSLIKELRQTVEEVGIARNRILEIKN